jgi:hypothetical protein
MAPTTTIEYLGGIHELNVDKDEGEERDLYHGFDPATGRAFNLDVGEETEVSDAKAEQLATDFPGCFKVDGTVAGKRAKKPTESKSSSSKGGDGDDIRDQLLAHKRDELNAAAVELGIEAPEALPNKAAVVDAILEAKAAEE